MYLQQVLDIHLLEIFASPPLLLQRDEQVAISQRHDQEEQLLRSALRELARCGSGCTVESLKTAAHRKLRDASFEADGMSCRPTCPVASASTDTSSAAARKRSVPGAVHVSISSITNSTLKALLRAVNSRSYCDLFRISFTATRT